VNEIETLITGSDTRLGTYAKESIDVGDAYLSIPPDAVIDSNTAFRNAESSPELKLLVERYAGKDCDGFMMFLI
jgi:hypothetical protein